MKYPFYNTFYIIDLYIGEDFFKYTYRDFNNIDRFLTYHSFINNFDNTTTIMKYHSLTRAENVLDNLTDNIKFIDIGMIWIYPDYKCLDKINRVHISSIFNNLPMTLEYIEIGQISYDNPTNLSHDEITQLCFPRLPYGCKVIYHKVYNKNSNAEHECIDKYKKTASYRFFKHFMNDPLQASGGFQLT